MRFSPVTNICVLLRELTLTFSHHRGTTFLAQCLQGCCLSGELCSWPGLGTLRPQWEDSSGLQLTARFQHAAEVWFHSTRAPSSASSSATAALCVLCNHLNHLSCKEVKLYRNKILIFLLKCLSVIQFNDAALSGGPPLPGGHFVLIKSLCSSQ